MRRRETAAAVRPLPGGPHWSLLLFAGTAADRQACNGLADLGRRVGLLTGGEVRTGLVLPQRTPPGQPSDVPVFQDVDGEAHRLYGAQAGALYLVRPDGSIGHRAQPADDRGLIEHLEAVLDVDGVRARTRSKGVPTPR